jgi:hypothetical protein
MSKTTKVITKKRKPVAEDAQVIHVDQSPPGNQIAVRTPDQLLVMAVEKGLGMDQLEKLMDLQDRWQKQKAKDAFTRAMSEFQNEVPSISKNRNVNYDTSKGGKVDYNYAELDFIVDTIKPIKHKHGFSHDWKYRHFKDDKTGSPMIEVTCIVSHIDGHSESTSMQGEHDSSGNKNSIQMRGSTVTFLQRYTLVGAFGLTTKGADNDGRSAGQGGGDGGEKKPIVSKTKITPEAYQKYIERAKAGEIVSVKARQQLALTEEEYEALELIEEAVRKQNTNEQSQDTDQ